MIGKERGSFKGCFFNRQVGCVLLFMLIQITYSGTQPWSVSSPNSGVVIEVKQDIIAAIASNQRNCYFRVLLNNNTVIDWSPLGVTTNDQNFVTNLTFVRDSQATINETYTLPSGKRSTYIDNCNELVLVFSNANSRQVAFYIRAYNDAAAVRSELRGTGSTQVTGEVTGFTIASGTGWAHSPGGNEKVYTQFSAGSAAGSYADPVLFKTTNGWALLADVAVYGDYTGCNFSSKSASRNVYQITFTGGQGPISGTLPWKLPWRVAIVGSTLGPIVESSVVENLNPPCEIADVSWIKPGRCAWSYPTQDNDHSVTLQRHYVDFASQMGWEYNTTDWNFDKSQMPSLCQYATQKNVDEELWYNYTEVRTQAQQDNVFSQCRTWGVKSLKIDFIFNNGDENTSCNQDLMKWYDMTAKNLAANKLMATMHGNTVPRGQRRRWPNVMTWEGVMGYEWLGRGYGGPRHNCSVPFIRQIIGPMDLTPVLFDLEQLSNGPGSQRTSTDAHELACAVIMESGLQHYADRPEYYNVSIGKPFLQSVPAAWDDIHFIDGNIGESTILARRKGNDWYVAGISALSARTMSVPLSFLKAGSYTVDLYKDSTGGTKYTMAKQTVIINPSTPLSVWVKENGGFCCRIPNSYSSVSTMRETNGTIYEHKRGGMDRLKLYHLVQGTSGGNRIQAGRVVDIRGKTIKKRNAGRLPQGVFIGVGSE